MTKQSASRSLALLSLSLYLLLYCGGAIAQEGKLVSEKQRPGIFDFLFSNDGVTEPETQNKENEGAVGTTLTVEEGKGGSVGSYAKLKVIDKNLGKLYELDISIGDKQSINELTVKVLSCFTGDVISVTPEGRALLEVYEERGRVNERLFHGWMYAQSPASTPFMHNRYDIMLGACMVR